MVCMCVCVCVCVCPLTDQPMRRVAVMLDFPPDEVQVAIVEEHNKMESTVFE